MLWEHPISHSLWLGKALPRSWLSEGSEAIRLIDGATAYGRLSFELTSSIASNASIHANPADDTEHPAVVWTLPPTLRQGEENRARYLEIGESDRMTLRFRKPE